MTFSVFKQIKWPHQKAINQKAQKRIPNKVTTETKMRVERVLSILEETIEYDLTANSSLERKKLWKDCKEFVRPKLGRTELTTNDNTVNFIVKIDE